MLDTRQTAAILLAGAILSVPARAADSASVAPAPAERRQTALDGPLLGYAPSPDRASVDSFRGIPGAAFAGSALALPEPMRALAVSSERAFALAIRASSGLALIYRLGRAGETPVGLRVSPDGFAADRAELSPTGSSAVVYNSRTRVACILRGLPVAPERLRSITLPASEPVEMLAVRDDGEEWLAVLGTGPRSGKIVAFSGDAPARTVYSGGRDLQVRFEPRAGRILIADRDRGEVWIASGPVQGRELRRVPAARSSAAPLDAAFSREIVAVLHADGWIAFHRNGDSAEREIDCACRPAGLTALSGPDLFQISGGPGTAAVVRVDLENPLVFLVAREGIPASPQSRTPIRSRHYR